MFNNSLSICYKTIFFDHVSPTRAQCDDASFTRRSRFEYKLREIME